MTNEEAIKRLKEVQAEFNENWVDYGGINEAFEKAYQALDERPQGEWTPVSERLPEERINPYTNDFEEVLCSTDWDEVLTFKFGTPILHHEPHFWLGGAIMDEHIIAWQPLPEPYKKGGAV